MAQGFGQIEVRGIGAPVFGIGTAIGLVVGHDVVARTLEMLVDLRVEALVRRFGKIALLQEVDEGRGGLLNEEQRRCLRAQ